MTEMTGTDESLGRSPDELRAELASAVRLRRTELGLTQAQLAGHVDASRFIINRIEAGAQDPSRELAKGLADYLERPDILALLETKIAADEQARERGWRSPPPTERSRDAELAALLSTPGLERLVVVLADDFDVLGLLTRHRVDLPPVVQIFFPTRGLQADLAKTNRGVGAWNCQRQIVQLLEAIDTRSIKVYESDRITQSLVLLTNRDGTYCVTWPMLPNIGRNEVDPGAMPASVTKYHPFIRQVDTHINELKSDLRPLTRLKVVVVVEPEPTETTAEVPAGAAGSEVPIARHRLSEFFRLGMDDERRLTPAAAPSEANFGFAVSLVLVHGEVKRTGRGVGHRVLLERKNPREPYQLLSFHVSDEDLLDLRSEGRSTRVAYEAGDLFRDTADYPFVPIDVFTRAVCSGFEDSYGLTVQPGHLEEVPLPERLWCVEKEAGRAAIVPRLFQLDLAIPASGLATAASSQTWSGLPLSRRADLVGLGQLDFLDEAAQLQDFLRRAVSDETEWFRNLLDSLRIAER